MSELKSKTQEVIKLLDDETTKSNKELLIAAGVCTLIGLIIGFIFGKITTSKSIIRKYNAKYSYDFGEDDEDEE